jgi:hypothetical protein
VKRGLFRFCPYSQIFIVLIFQFESAIADSGLQLRDQRGAGGFLKTTKPPHSDKTENEGIRRIPSKQLDGLASSFSLRRSAPMHSEPTSAAKPVS